MEKYGYNLDGDAKFYVNTIVEEDYKFTIFYSDFTKNFIEKNIGARNYLMDGTFDKLPLGYYQLLIISFVYQNDVRINAFIRLPAC